jgi:RimJ/RimL family protein N-acetyltransferase
MARRGTDAVVVLVTAHDGVATVTRRSYAVTARARIVPESGRVIGEISLRVERPEHRQGEIGFVFHPDFHGHGFATEAAAELLRIGFDIEKLHRIIATCDARNAASARVMERLGMRREAHFVHNEIFKGEWGDEFVYAIIEDEWRR